MFLLKNPKHTRANGFEVLVWSGRKFVDTFERPARRGEAGPFRHNLQLQDQYWDELTGECWADTVSDHPSEREVDDSLTNPNQG